MSDTCQETLLPTRRLIDGVYYRVDVSRDGDVEVNMGPDDQRPEADGIKFFVPIHVREKTMGMQHPTYCGKCRKRMAGQWDRARSEWTHCPRCGAGIAHYNWTMGDIEWTRSSYGEELPDCLSIFGNEGLSLKATANALRLNGAISENGESPSDATAETKSVKAGQ